MSAPPGWLWPSSHLLALEERAGLRLLDAEGSDLGRLEGPAAAALRARAVGEPGESALLDAILSAAPRLGAGLEGAAWPLTPARLVGRGRWGLLFVELTARCNERCAHCYAEAGPERAEALERATAERVVDDAAALGFAAIQFTGGEALLCPFLPDLCARARAAGIATVEVYTNGLLLSDERYARLRASDVAFAFSLYAANPARHDAVTGVPGSHARTCEAIARAVRGGSRARVGVVVTRPEDEAEGFAAAALAERLGATVTLDVNREVGRGTFAGRALVGAAAVGAHRPDDGAPALPGDGAHPAEAARRADDAPSGAPPDRTRGGTAAVLPDGSVVPCIFSRRLRLGRVGPDGGLRDALAASALALALADAAPRLATNVARMTCAPCRLVDALLEQRTPGRLPRAEVSPA